MKRENYISWDEYFMGVALLAAKRSKDPNRQVGACIVRDRKILATGYNGFPWHCSDNEFPWVKNESDPLNNKHLYVVHAELNAILNYSNDLKNSTLYVDLFPCNECAKAIIQSGIKYIYYLSDEDCDKVSYKASKYMLENVGIEIYKMEKTKFIEDFIKLGYNTDTEENNK